MDMQAYSAVDKMVFNEQTSRQNNLALRKVFTSCDDLTVEL